ncbi:MAG: patatin-like phospholipase family protein [Pseudomonadota bacterium]
MPPAQPISGCCDLVMKGGLASGVVYPDAVVEIAKRMHLVGIGGTSAGAIAAVLAAAAEYRRRHTGSDAGFDMFAQIVDELKSEGRLLRLFTPEPDTKTLFDCALKFIKGEDGFGTKVGLVWRLRSKRSRRKFFQPLRDNDMGVSSGMAHDALTPWLSGWIDRIAGLPDGQHLTFRDLHAAPPPAAFADQFDGVQRSIDLRAVTTCLTFNRPLEFPFDTNIFAFDEAEWRRLFPSSVVSQVVASSADIDSDWLRRDGKLPLPRVDLPIICAARMSLSFPLLFSLVPLWSANVHEPGEPLERVLFSDGGITSNFPIHIFDALYARWPTLGLTLQEKRPNRSRRGLDASLVHLAADRRDVSDLWSKFLRDDPTGSLLGFVGAIFGSAQNWHDNSFLKLPGYRDRVAEIWLDTEADEGGTNVDMPPAMIDALVARGREAGRRLAERFADPDSNDTMSRRGHTWARYRSGMSALVELLQDFQVAVGADFDASQLAALFANEPNYEFPDAASRDQARDISRRLHELAAAFGEPAPFDDEQHPNPPVVLGTRAPLQR